MKKKLLLFIMLLCTFLVQQKANAQLSPGDIAFIGYNTSPLDGFSFIVLKDIPSGTIVYFTERGWNGTTWVTGSTEPHLQWTVPSLTPVGTIISVMETSADTFTITGTTGIGYAPGFTTGFNLSGGDQMLAYQSATGVQPVLPDLPTFIAGVHGDYNSADYDTTTKWNLNGTTGGNSSALPLGLTNGTNCISLFPAPGPEYPNAKYNGTLTGNVATLLGLINNPSNWLIDTNTGSPTNFAITAANYPTPSISTTPPVFTLQPASKTICSGTNTSFSVVATNATGYQWQIDQGAGFNNLTNTAPYSGVTTTTLTITGATSAMNGYTYRCVATGASSVNSNSAILTVPTTLGSTITSQSNVSTYGANNGSATISVSGGTTPYFYSWSPSGGTAATASGLSAGTYTVTITDSTPNGIGGCNKTQTVTITEPAGSIVSTTSLTAFTSCGGASTEQSFTISGGGLTSSLDVFAPTGFEISTSAGGTYTNNISFPNVGGVVTTKTIYARLAASATGTPSGNITVSSTGITTKNVAVTGSMNSIAITAQPTASTICAGANTTFSATASNATGYQWQVDQGAGFNNISNNATYSGANTATLTITGATAGLSGYIYRVIATGTCPSATSNSAALTVNMAPAITAQPSASTICAGAATTFTATAANATGYQWQVDQGAGFNNISNNATYSGANTATLTITGATAGLNGYIYRVVATGSCTPNATSNSAALTVNMAPAITAQPSASTICAGANTIFTATAANATGYQWQVDQGAGFNNIANNATYSGANTATLTITGATAGLNGYIYRVVVTGSCTPNATSNSAALTVNMAPAITAQPSASIICAGANTTFTATAANATGYQWQVDQGAGFSSITNGGVYSGATSATLTITGATAGLSGYLYRVVATGLCTPDATSNTALLTVNQAPSITAQPTDSSICSGSSTTFSASAANAVSYQWQVNTGSGFNNITAGAPYSGETTATLTITGATAAINNYQYRLVASGNCTPVAVTNSVTLQVSNISVVSSKVDIACNGDANGSLSVVPTGGIGSYTYLWSNNATSSSINNLAPGNYSVSVKDAILCEKILNFTINEPPVLVASQGTVNNVSCNSGANGTATVSVTGGTPGYTYSWSPSGGTAATASGLSAGTYTVTVTDANGCQTTQSFTITEPTILSAAASQTDVSCNGGTNGSASVVITGGAGGYTYFWSPSGGTAATASGLAAGTYTVTATDANNCQITQSFTITEPTVLTALPVAQTNIACFGGNTGSATVTATGGTGAYTYSWAPSGGTAATATGLTAGTYTVTITDANGCQATQSFTITEPAAPLTATAGAQSNTSCNGGANGFATVNISGGTPGYTYSWAPYGGTSATAFGLAAGTFTVTVTDANGCQATQTFTITEPTALTASFGAQTNVSCNGGSNGSATVNVTGGTGAYTYSWSPYGGTSATASGLTAGTYTVTVSDANTCQTTQSFTITEPAVLSATPSHTDVLCNGSATGTATVTVSGGTPGYTYLWSPSGGTAATATGLTVGNYSVLVTDANGCTITQNFIILEPTVLTATQNQINATCSTGGQATVNVSGGTPPYTYLWSPSGATTATATGLAAGTNSVLVTDANGCNLGRTFTISTTNTLVASTFQTDVLCNGGTTGSATVIPSGAPGPFAYVWSPFGGNADTATNLTAGNYSVTITASNGCSIVKNFTINEPSALVVTPNSQTNVSCYGGSNGSASVTVTGGTGGYTYSWSPSGGTAATASGLSAGTYTVTVTDANGCTQAQSFTITEPNALVATTSQTDVSCNGGANGTATANVNGGTGAYTYSWAPYGGTAATATGLAAGNFAVTITDANSCQTVVNVTITEPAILSATVAQTNVTCNGLNNGTATVTTSGGTAPYTYSWSPSGGTTATASGLSPGTYTATITDANGCTTTQTTTITEPSALAVTPSHTNVSCNSGANGTATVSVSGGTPGYTYSWAPYGGTSATATGLTAGTYTATITDANGCIATETFIITEPTALSTTASQTDVSCNGGANGTATVTVIGGTPAYTYSWAPFGGTAATATGLSAGTYTVTITDANNCQITQSYTILEPSVLSLTSTQTNVSCNAGANGTATVTAAGGTAPYTYSWSPFGGTAATASGLTAGTYTVTVTDANACTATESVTITEPVILSATTSATNVSCNGGNDGTATVTAAGGTGAYTYAWSPAGGNAATASGLGAGTYTVTVTDANSCSTTQTVTITQPIALSVTASHLDVSCNGGANGTATVAVTGGTGTYTYSWAPFGGTAATATGLTAGTYTVIITDANGCTATESIVIAEPNALTATTASTNVSCNGGSNGTAAVTAVGGTGAYTYLWSPSGGTAATATGLTAGTYTVIVTDANNCQTTQSVTITEPAVLAATTSKTDVTCSGVNDGTASVTVTGGTGTYTYAWSPSGGNAATATGLSPNTYTVTITDSNGCFITETINIITTPDVTAPVPTVASLPEITNYCSVSASEIAIPTATDNCAGTINGTTTDPLNYNTVGTYVITWSYNDGNGNITTQPQTVKVAASPLNAVTFADAQFTYDGNTHSLQVANLPSGASVTYSANNASTNAGTYVVTATVTPPAGSHCAGITLTANLVINKAPQQITFNAIPVKTLGANNSFNLTAASSSNLAVTYTSTYTTPLAPATVSASGTVNMLRAGEMHITAHQAGDNNYLPAADVTQTLVILNNNIDVKRIVLGTKVFENPGKVINYVLPCGETNPSVSVVNESGAIITPSANFTIQTPKPGIYNQNVTITSQDGTLSATYSITVEKPFNFFDIVKQKFNNVLLVNNNPQTNGGYDFVSYEWFKNGQSIGTGQYYSVGNSITDLLDPTADYSVKMTTRDGKVLQTCPSKITLTNTLAAKLYPNPIEIGKVITVEADFPTEELEKMQISLYSVTGQLVKTVQSSTAKTEIQLPQTTESNMYLVVLETPNIKKSFKVIVK
ncbi:T9SS type A sorting domain-containing protein [Flavobacterium defluvii]|uniref:Por secretion system C-terminal sorting domain-containing protein n=1 Tax=Flavobacterium defluvii TaxID=370979 RepID=A0A1M5UJQ9_9FLAO|nr:T9SS type A sorting domain-containing protein [Flavobacterium defluvii]SHH63274.1 Por secretion system C-terminal sorting domain-containing protein [Flavobacterium defluvii]